MIQIINNISEFFDYAEKNIHVIKLQTNIIFSKTNYISEKINLKSPL